MLTSKAQSLTAYTVKSIEGRYTEDLQQTITVPEFSGWGECNMMRIGDVLYWIIDSRTSTDTARSIRFEISACGPSSLLHKGDAIKGIYSRLPTNECTYMMRSVISSALVYSRDVDLPKLPTYNGKQVFWVQISSTRDPFGETPREDTINRLGVFVAVGSDLGTMISLSDGVGYYPNLRDIISNPEYLGLTASTITDISISCRCPYTVSMSGNTITAGGVTANYTSTAGTAQFKAYALDHLTSPLPTTAQTVAVTLSAIERGNGTITLRDEDGSNLADLSGSWGDTITATVQCVADFTAIYTFITINGYNFTIQEGHLPWVGSSWSEYRAYSLAYDRQSMENSINYANQRVAVRVAEGAASASTNLALSAAGGTPASMVTGLASTFASTALSTWAAYKEQSIYEAEQRASQRLAERRAMGQPGTAYNTGYGLIYCWLCNVQPANIQVEMPAQLTEAMDADYAANFGYPAENVRTYAMRAGFIQGRMLDNSITRGRLFDRTNDALQRGIKFVEI